MFKVFYSFSKCWSISTYDVTSKFVLCSCCHQVNSIWYSLENYTAVKHHNHYYSFDWFWLITRTVQVQAFLVRLNFMHYVTNNFCLYHHHCWIVSDKVVSYIHFLCFIAQTLTAKCFIVFLFLFHNLYLCSFYIPLILMISSYMSTIFEAIT